MVSEQERLERYLKVLNEQLDRKRGTEDFKIFFTQKGTRTYVARARARSSISVMCVLNRAPECVTPFCALSLSS